MSTDRRNEHLDDLTLSRFADGELSVRSSRRVRSHLRSCEACREEVQFIRTLSAAIRSIPSPKPPDELFDDLFRQEPDGAAVVQFRAPQRRWSALSRVPFLSAWAVLPVLIAVVLALAVGTDRVMAGSSSLSLQWEEPDELALQYETVSFAAESRLRARLRYWVPDSLRYGQTASGYAVVELSGRGPGVFSGAVDLPPGTAYAVAAVEDLAGTYIDTDFGRLWEYLETEERERPTLQARRHQLLATSELSAARTAAVAEEAAAQFPEQPEFRVWQLLFAQGAVPPESRDSLLREHAARLVAMDRLAREGNPDPVELDALHRYSALLGRPDLASYWSDQLMSLYPQHEAAVLLRLQAIARSSMTTRRKLEALEESWTSVRVPITAQIGLRLALELAEPDVVGIWLDRHSRASVFRDLTYDAELARDLMAVPKLASLAEVWILDRLADGDHQLEPDRPLDQARRNFRAARSRLRAQLNIDLANLRLVRGQLRGALEAADRAVEQTWSSEVFLEAAEIHRAAGSDLRAAELLSFAQVDPITPSSSRPRTDPPGGLPSPSEGELATARATMYNRVTATLLDEHVDLNAHIRFATGTETTLRDAAGGSPVVVVYAVRPDFVADEALALLDANLERLGSAGVQVLRIAQQTAPAPLERSGFDSRFHYDVRYEAWDNLRAWREVQYFVLDSGRIRHRGADLGEALRVSLVLSTRAVASD